MPDPITPKLPDPQATVDAALGPLDAPVANVATPTSTAQVAMGDDTPLAFATATLNAPINPGVANTVTPPTTESVNANLGSSYLPPVPPAPPTNEVVADKPKQSKLGLVIGLVLVIMSGLGIAGYYAYSKYGQPKPNQVAGVLADKTQATCNGCFNGGWMVWRNGECRITGICNSGVPGKDTENPNVNTTLDSQSTCEGAGKGYVWCASVDSVGRSYAFCNTKGIGCNQAASEEGYTIIVGSVKCIQVGVEWKGDHENIRYYWADSAHSDPTKLQAAKDAVDANCKNQMSKGGFGNGKYICREGVKGEDGVVYSGGPCTALNGKLFTGNLSCFCGTIQEDTGSGHNSYTSTCGCKQDTPTHKACNLTTKVCETVNGAGADTCTTDANCVTTTPTLACTGLTQTPATTPVIGDKVTFTCAGSITPAGAASLSYKFRYSLNDGADQLLANKTATTAELTINACGTYSVQCKVCATIAGVLTCNPTWTGAVQ